MLQLCPLCASSSHEFFNHRNIPYYQCDVCKGIFVKKSHLPSKNKEIERYLQHNNDVNDPLYQQFVLPLVNAVISDFSPKHKGLDFGAGTGPVVSKMLHDLSYDIVLYDPFFHNHQQLLLLKYDYIVACEVIEHFHNPSAEFSLLKALMKPGAILYCMTSLYNESIDFASWYYKNDHTHVFIYHAKSIEYISTRYGFSDFRISNNMIRFINQ